MEQAKKDLIEKLKKELGSIDYETRKRKLEMKRLVEKQESCKRQRKLINDCIQSLK